MAYYPWDSAHEPVQPVTPPEAGTAASGIGAYYAWDSAHEPVEPINGLGETGEAKLSDEALRALLGRRPPRAVVAPWALQVTDLEWQEVPHAKQSSFTLLPLTDRDLNQARRGAFGAQAQVVGVLMKRPRSLADQALAFVGTPYGPVFSLAVYSLTDTRRVALPYFLTLAVLRDVAATDRGSRSPAAAARSLGGELVYAVSLPMKPGDRAPGAEFQQVFRAIGDSAAAPAPVPVAAPASASSVPLGLYFGLGAIAVGGAWWFLSRGEQRA